MVPALRRAMEAEPTVAYALLFGSSARGTARPDSDADVAIELVPGAARDVHTLGGLAARLESAAGRRVDVVLLDEAPAPLAYRIFRGDGDTLIERNRSALVARKARVILDYLDFKPVEDLCAAGILRAAPAVVDRAVLAAKIGTVRDATVRVRAVLPASVEVFAADRTAREIVTLNVFVAIQACLDLATHWLADAGWDLPGTYGDVFTVLAEHGVITRELATRLAAAAAFRNLVAHQYGVLDWRRVHALAASNLGDLDTFCAALAERAGSEG
jgi:uncharacterized protein YutE (UPF0331/DUF86 family)/predicted nucleotidyltransferase